ncbi:SH3 domain-containing protein [Salinarimonas soli]|uniref:SH3 domain-containing protein n=1 Tax=Salinarimonas soli TaxID=1638099 RepID=A0A5B2VBW4_9HYPH|nr:SH3 domain-containing protein [Salinarimonas soli]KAA2236248.1 SH3 domain-containing protein [Salinarimonas soli]
MLPAILSAVAFVGLTVVPAAAAPAPGRVTVIGVGEGDVLNLRAEPRAEAPKVGELPRDAAGIEATRCVSVMRGRIVPADEAPGASRWCRVSLGDQEGWANARFLAPESEAATEEAGKEAKAAPLYSAGPTAEPGGRQRSFLVSATQIGAGRFRAETRHIVRREGRPDSLEEATAIVDCRQRPQSRERDAANLWWAVCRGEMQRFGG